jgi:hypothetical protein
VKAELKRLHSPDIDDLKNYSPSDKECFGFLLQIMVGVQDKEGEESFDVVVCTPQWLLLKYQRNGLFFALHHLIMFQYDYTMLFSKLKSYIDNIHGDNWNDIAHKISYIGKWEFQNYKS